jgi:Alpha galactosidase A
LLLDAGLDRGECERLCRTALDFGCNINEQLIKATANTLVSTGLSAAGYNFLNLDDCWMVGGGRAAQRSALPRWK